ncbi:MAG: hypothetical protein AB7E21_13865 [Pseudodonghicola sp.]|uniref:hypothetical protein n=1 Tax=Pseudodonghicola sp. TaxID=1969463 RepID=UPI003A9715EF
MSDLDDFAKKMKNARDELKLQLHLGSKEAEQEWQELQAKWDSFVSKTELDKSAAEVGEAAKDLGLKLKAAFDRMRKS